MTTKEKLRYEEAATRKVNMAGWVCKTCGRFHGDYPNSEHYARWCCAESLPCECGGRREKHYTVCKECRRKREDEKWRAREERKWDGKSMLYSEAIDRYFNDPQDAEDYAACDESLKYEDMQLVICKPCVPPTFELDEFLADVMPEDFEDSYSTYAGAKELEAAINKWVADNGPYSWQPGKYALKGQKP